MNTNPILFLIFFIFYCASHASQPWLMPNSISVQVIGQAQSANPKLAASNKSTVSVRLIKSEILTQKFTYEIGFQYASGDLKPLAGNPVIAIPVIFQISGDTLNLVTDRTITSSHFTTEKNSILVQWKITHQDADTLTAEAQTSSSTLEQQIPRNTFAPLPSAVQSAWIRNGYVEESNQLWMLESTLQLQDGTLLEMLESIYPTQMFLTSPEFQPIALDPSMPAGTGNDSPNPVQSRFTFANFPDGIEVSSEHNNVIYAAHYDIHPTLRNPEGTIDFYAGSEVPQELYTAVGSAIEGYNRFFEKFKGIERRVIRFKGAIPSDVVPLDPRYNFINYVDSMAFEAMAVPVVDATTGKVIHSAVRFTKGFVQKGLAEAKGAIYLEPNLQLNDVDSFVRSRYLQWLKGGLLHEVGHTLGFGHNPKASSLMNLEGGLTQAARKIISTMEAPPLEIQTQFFDSVDSSNGQNFEWDRQFLSALYNKAADVDETQAALPVCDFGLGGGAIGIDPLCRYYDGTHQPLNMIELAFARWQNKSLANWTTAFEAIGRIPQYHLSEAIIINLESQNQWTQVTTDLRTAVQTVLNYYMFDSGFSIGEWSGNLSTLAAMLKSFRSESVPQDWDVEKIHATDFKYVEKILDTKNVSQSIHEAIGLLKSEAKSRLSQTPYFLARPEAEQKKVIADLEKQLDSEIQAYEQQSGVGLSKLRVYLLSKLTAASKEEPYFVSHSNDGTTLDFKNGVIDRLAQALRPTSAYYDRERLAAAQSLATFQSDQYGHQTIELAKASLQNEISEELNPQRKQALQKILDALNQ